MLLFSDDYFSLSPAATPMLIIFHAIFTPPPFHFILFLIAITLRQLFDITRHATCLLLRRLRC